MTLATGDRVVATRSGTVSFVRSGFARVRWDSGVTSDEWASELLVVEAVERGRCDGGHRFAYGNQCCMDCGETWGVGDA